MTFLIAVDRYQHQSKNKPRGRFTSVWQAAIDKYASVTKLAIYSIFLKVAGGRVEGHYFSELENKVPVLLVQYIQVVISKRALSS